MFSSFSGANLGRSNLWNIPAGDRDPHRKVKEMRFIGIADACVAAISIVFHTWILSGQSDGVVNVGLGLSLLIISFGVLIFFNWKFVNGLKQLSIKPVITIKDSNRWRNCSVFSLVVVIIILLIYVVTRGSLDLHPLHLGSTELYVIYLLCILGWRIYGIHRIGKFIDDIVCHTSSGADNRIYYVPTQNVLIT